MGEQYVVDRRGKKTAVILPVDEYEQLLEDLHDLAVVAERRGESSVSLAELKLGLEKTGPVRIPGAYVIAKVPDPPVGWGLVRRAWLPQPTVAGGHEALPYRT